MAAVAQPSSPETASPAEIKVGDSVLGHFHDGCWYGASIVELRGDQFVVCWDDGDEEDTIKTRDQIRPKQQKDQGEVSDNAAPSPEPNQAISAAEAQTRGQDPAQGPATPPKEFPSGGTKQEKGWASTPKQAASKPLSTPQASSKLSTPEQEPIAAPSVPSSLASSAETVGSPPQPEAEDEPSPAALSPDVSSASEPKTPTPQPPRTGGGQGGGRGGGGSKLERWLNRTAKQAKHAPPPSAEKGVQQTPPQPSAARSPRTQTPSQNTTKLDRWLQRTNHSRSPRHSPRNVEAIGGGGGVNKTPSPRGAAPPPASRYSGVVRDARGTSKLDRWLSRTAVARARSNANNANRANGQSNGPANNNMHMPPPKPAQASPSPSPSSKLDRWLTRSTGKPGGGSGNSSGGAGNSSNGGMINGREQAAPPEMPGAGDGGERGCEAMRAWMMRAGRRQLAGM
eukprot:1714598-Rhodomonas_salina.1